MQRISMSYDDYGRVKVSIYSTGSNISMDIAAKKCLSGVGFEPTPSHEDQSLNLAP